MRFWLATLECEAYKAQKDGDGSQRLVRRKVEKVVEAGSISDALNKVQAMLKNPSNEFPATMGVQFVGLRQAPPAFERVAYMLKNNFLG